MRLPRRTFAPLALPFALLCTLAGPAIAQADIAITSPAHQGFTNDRTPVVTFTGAAPGGVVTLEVAGSPAIGDTVADINGDGTVAPSTDIVGFPGEQFGITVRDPGGTGPAMDTVTVHIDQAPSLTGTGDGTYAPAEVIFYASSAIPEHEIKLYIDGDADETVTADEDGNYYDDIVPTAALLTAGPHTAYLKSVDAGGIESSPGETVNFNVAPAAPTFTQFFENIQLNQAQPAVTFHDVDPTASKVTLYHVVEVNGIGTEVEIGASTVVIGGTATITPSALSDGYHYLVAKQTVNGVETVSYLGNNGPTTVVVNTSAPVLEPSFSGPLTEDNRPYFYVENALANFSDNDTYALLYIDGVTAGSDGGDGGGAAGIRPDVAISEGSHSAYVVTVDDLGHHSAVHSNTIAFTVDSLGPAAPTVTSPADGSTTATSLPVLTVTAEPGSLVHVLVDDVGEESALTADANGDVTFTLTQPLTDGVHTLHVIARDALLNWGQLTTTTFTVLTPKTPTPPTPPAPPAPPAPPTPTPTDPTDPDDDGISNSWTVGGKAAPAPGTPKASVAAGKVKLKLAAAPKGAKSVRVYRADGKGAYKLVKTLKPNTKAFTDAKVKAGHSYKYKTVGVNAKGQQSKASGTATAKIKKK